MVLDDAEDDDIAAKAAAATVVDASSEVTVDADSDIKSFVPAAAGSVMMSSDTTHKPPLLVASLARFMVKAWIDYEESERRRKDGEVAPSIHQWPCNGYQWLMAWHGNQACIFLSGLKTRRRNK